MTVTTFESPVPGTLSYDEGLQAIVMTLGDLLDYLSNAELPDELESLALELRKSIDKLALIGDDDTSYAAIDAAPSSPQEAAAKAVRVFKIVRGLLRTTCVQAATSDPVKAIQLRALEERLDEQSVVFERYVWLGTTKKL